MTDVHKRRTLFFQLRGLLGIVILVLLAYHRTTVPSTLWVLGVGLLVSDVLILLLPLSWLEDPKLPYAVFIIDSGILTIVLYRISGYDSETLLLYYLTLFMATLGQSVRKSIGIAVVASAFEIALRLGRGGSMLHDPDTLTHIPLFFVTAVLCSYLAENARTHEQRARELTEAQDGFVKDIARYAGDLTASEQLRAEAQALAQRLRENEERLRLFVEHAPAPIAMLDRNMKYLAASRRWLTDFHLGDQDIVGRSYYDLFPGLPERWKEVHQRCLAGAVEKSDEDSFPRPDGTADWLRWEIRPWHEPSGEVGGLLLFSELITERKRAEQALRDSEARYRRFHERNAAGVLRNTLDGRILDCNWSLVRMLGYDSIEDLKRRSTTELYFYPEARHVMLKRVKNDKVLISNEMCFKRKDGSPVWVLFNVSLIEGEDDSGDVLEGTIIDISERKRAEEALRQSEEQYRLLFQSNPHPMWVYDLETLRFLAVNDAAIEHYGYTRDEFLAMTIRDIRPPEDVPALLESVASATGSLDKSGAWRHLTKNGKRIDVEISSHSILFAGRNAELVLANDITERTLTEAENRRLAMAIEQSADGIVVTDVEGIIQYVNPAFSAMTGYARGEALGQSSRLLKSGAHGDEFYQSLWKTITAGNVWYGEIINRRKDGTLYTEAMTIAPVRDPSGAITNFIAVKEDVTERKQAEESLRKNEASLARAQRIAHLGNWEQDLIKDELHWSDECYRIFGVTADNFAPSFEEILRRVHPEDREMVKKASVEALYQNRPYSIDHRIVLPDGSERFVHEEAEITRDEIGKAISMLGTVQDITEGKQLEQQFRQAQKMEAVGRLAGGVAHDFNNLLTIINGYSEFTLDSLKHDDPNRKYVEEIRKAGERAASLTRQLLAFSRQQVMELQVLDLNSVIASMDRMLRRLIGEDIDLVTVAGKDFGRVKADPGQIEQIIVNLAVNARDAMPHGGKLTIATRNAELDESYARNHAVVQSGPYVMLAVSDTGVGMDAETQKHIFEPFFTTKEKGKGTGLGLSTVYGIVKQSGGNIWVYSEPGKGTTFKIYLPRIDEPVEIHGRAKADAEAASGTETVLVVEDESAVRMLVLQTLESKGYRVLEANNGAEALLVAAEHQGPIALLITDVIMPGIGGRDLADRLAASRPEMKVLYMSGYTDNAIVHHGVLEPGTAFLQKPFTPEIMARRVREVLNSGKHNLNG